MNLSMIHIVSLILTLVATILPGVLAARKIKSADDYNVGGRSAGVGLVAGSIIGTIVGGAATMGTAQLGFKLGLTAWWFTLGSGIALIIMAIFYAVPLRRSSLTTVSEFLVGNYGKVAEIRYGKMAEAQKKIDELTELKNTEKGSKKKTPANIKALKLNNK